MKRIVILLSISLFAFSVGFSQTPKLGNSSTETISNKQVEESKEEPKLMASEKKDTTDKNKSSVPKISAIEKKEEKIKEESSSPN